MSASPVGRLVYYVDDAGDHRWRFIVNGRIVADSGQGYSRREGARNGWAALCRKVRMPAGVSVEVVEP